MIKEFFSRIYDKLMLYLIEYGVIYLLYAIGAIGYLISPSSLLLVINLCILITMLFFMYKFIDHETKKSEKRIKYMVWNNLIRINKK